MLKRTALVSAGVLLAAGGLFAADKWHDGRVAECERRSTDLSAIDLLSRQPDGVQPDAPYAGCDQESVVAYAGRQFVTVTGPAVDNLTGRVAARLDEAAVTAFYRQALISAGWQISTRTPAPGPNAASLCATKKLAFGEANANLSFPVTGTYDLFVADDINAGARCV
jgi:hypothetical protein